MDKAPSPITPLSASEFFTPCSGLVWTSAFDTGTAYFLPGYGEFPRRRRKKVYSNSISIAYDLLIRRHVPLPPPYIPRFSTLSPGSPTPIHKFLLPFFGRIDPSSRFPPDKSLPQVKAKRWSELCFSPRFS